MQNNVHYNDYYLYSTLYNMPFDYLLLYLYKYYYMIRCANDIYLNIIL